MAATIYAPASGQGRAGIAVIRLSGPDAGPALRRLTGRGPPPPRRLTRTTIIDPGNGEVVDEGMAAWFPGPASYTGEDVVELHIHGGRAVLAGVLDALASCPGLRMALPGEFTRRAFINGKLDLTAAEGLADLVDAETAAQHRQALRQMRGELGTLYGDWRRELVGILAHLEATIDFSDQDLPRGMGAGIPGRITALRAAVAAHLADDRRGERLRAGLRLAIIGPPNSGKSSFLNLLAKRDAAIVSDIAGTTRDVIEVHLDMEGYPVVAADTAGLREAGDGIEGEGVRRARREAREADLKLAIYDGETWPKTDTFTDEHVDGDTVVAVNKVDLGAPVPPLEVRGIPARGISIHSGEGIEELMEILTREVRRRCQVEASPAITRARHREALEECVEALARGGGAPSPELMAEDLRLAARALGRITGEVGVEDLLDVIFGDFCIGK